MRLDHALVDRGLADNRSRARALVMAGRVRVDDRPATKAGMPVDSDDDLRVVETSPYVGRGGEKLEAALRVRAVDVQGRDCIDVGASTGGFSDCLLQHGARSVIAVDVGYGQLDWKLRQDPRVLVVERCNARRLTRADLPGDAPVPDLLVVDVSFIGAGKVLPAAGSVCAAEAEALILVKPQFECGPERVGSGGIVRSRADRLDAVATVARQAMELGWTVRGAVASPLRGRSGNWECFLHLSRPAPPGPSDPDEILSRLDVPEDDGGSASANTNS